MISQGFVFLEFLVAVFEVEEELPGLLFLLAFELFLELLLHLLALDDLGDLFLILDALDFEEALLVGLLLLVAHHEIAIEFLVDPEDFLLLEPRPFIIKSPLLIQHRFFLSFSILLHMLQMLLLNLL